MATTVKNGIDGLRNGNQPRRNLLKYLVRIEMASDWFTRIYRSILAEQISGQNRDMACKLGCGLFLSPQLKTVGKEIDFFAQFVH